MRDQQAVERIAVVKGERGDADEVRGRDRQDVELAGLDLRGDEALAAGAELELADRGLERELPRSTLE